MNKDLPESQHPRHGILGTHPLSCPCCGADIDRQQLRFALHRVPPAMVTCCPGCQAPLSTASGFKNTFIVCAVVIVALQIALSLSGHGIPAGFMLPLFVLVLFISIIVGPFLLGSWWQRSWADMAVFAGTGPLDVDRIPMAEKKLHELRQMAQGGFAPQESVETIRAWIESQQRRLPTASGARQV